MRERDGGRKYLYWAERRIHSIANGSGIRVASRHRDGPARRSIPHRSQLGPEAGTSAGPEFQPRRSDRNELALRVEMALGSEAVSDLAGAAPVRYARGRGTIVFSEFAHEPENPTMGLAFTEVARGGARVAVCLFGSIAEYADVITDVAPPVKGWSAASTRVISEFVKSRCTCDDSCWGGTSALVGEVLRVATRQGEENGVDDVVARPWRRGFTYGHVRDVGEWLAEVYLDVRAADLPGVIGMGSGRGSYDRVIVGAPLWIRTPSLRALTLYDEIPAQELDLDIGRYE